MAPINSILDSCRKGVRRVMRVIAKWLNNVSGGKLSPTAITIVGLLAHLPIAWLIGRQQNPLAALLLVIFGLFDTLDGELARLQNSTSRAGMLLDSVTDRIKEVAVYIGGAYALIANGQPYSAVWAVAACGASLVVSYINAWGEAVLAGGKTKHAVNQTFRSGLLTFDIRMFLVVVGLLFSQLAVVLVIIAVLAGLTALQRLTNITSYLNAQD